MINIISISLGGLIFIFSIICFARVFKMAEIKKLGLWWLVLIALIILFFLGYVGLDFFVMTEGETVNYPMLIGQIFLTCSMVVLITSVLIYLVVRQVMGKSRALDKAKKNLEAYNKNLEKLVVQRTGKLEQVHRRAIGREKEIQRLKDHFIFVAAHELRAPVNAIGWLLEMLYEDEEIQRLSPEKLEMLQDLEANKKRLVALAEDLLNVARIEYGAFKIEPKKINLITTINQSLCEMRLVAKRLKVKMIFKPAQKTLVVWADPERVKEMMMNLLNNGIKYNKTNGTVTVSVSKKNKYIEVSVKDRALAWRPKK
ncbi:HAMP domain-containing histidine kinase [Patescibacteria group bacterium]|nr:HAMP domain-containing histidine kinase [Patescibacteria group bacterium]